MKKLISLLGIMLVMTPFIVNAQLEDDTTVVFNAHLLETFNLNLIDGDVQEITFQTAAQYNLGVTQGAGILPGFTTLTMESTSDWELDIEFNGDFVPYGPNGGPLFIPLDNLGVWIEDVGTYQFGGEVTCPYQTADASPTLTVAPVELIGVGSGNTGDALDNRYILHWLMGTMQGGMNGTSMFDQMAAGAFGVGDYTTTATLTMREPN